MKSTHEAKAPTQLEHTYPALYQYVYGGSKLPIVLATDTTSGVVVMGRLGVYRIGERSEAWTPFADESTWRRLEPIERVILANDR